MKFVFSPVPVFLVRMLAKAVAEKPKPDPLLNQAISATPGKTPLMACLRPLYSSVWGSL